MKHALRFGLLILLSSTLLTHTFAQPVATSADVRQTGFAKRQQLADRSLFHQIPFENIGPTVFSGRVVDIEVNPADPSKYLVAYASGGLWKTDNNGTTFQPLFDHEMVMTIGDFDVDWDSGTIWLGTGESNSSRSSYAGNGMYRSDDYGQTWRHLGLDESHHVGRVLIHPDDNETVWVAACGHLYSSNAERGIYKTRDGGTTWQQVLFVNDSTSGIDLLLDPTDNNVLYAAMWERSRRAWNFVEGGHGSGIYKSTDGGDSWTLLSTESSGFPIGDGVGRIGLSAALQDGSLTLYALLDNYFRRPAEADESEALTKDVLRSMSVEDFKRLSDEKIEEYLRSNRFPQKYGLKRVKKMINSGQIKPVALVEYVEDANSLLFDTPVIGAEVYRSTDGGMTWTKTHEDYLDRLYNSYGYYFGQIRAHPGNPDKVYIMGVPLLRSNDGGSSWQSIGGPSVHSDHHDLWINPNRAGHLINGNDGGINTSYDDGESWMKNNSPSVGQFYAIAYDRARPYRVYGGTQDNGVWGGPSNYQASNRWHSTGRYPYQSVLGGDGMQVQVDWRDNNIIYTGFQFGNYFRIDRRSGKRDRISPRHELGERPLRFNWETPIHLSRHNQDILYLGSNKLHRSMDQGDSWKALSDDLTQGGRKGDVAFGTLTTIHESPLEFGLIYCGSDDGLVHVSDNGGRSWLKITDDLPSDLWIAQVMASHHHIDRVYVALNGYRWDDFTAYLYRSDDQGKTWTSISHDLPSEPINTVYEDPVNEDIIYVGTDHNAYISLDRGSSFMLLSNELPAVAVHDIMVQPDANDLLIGTHGRSIYRGYVGHIQQLDEELLASSVHIFEPKSVRKSGAWGRKMMYRDDPYIVPKQPLIIYAAEAGSATINLTAADGFDIARWNVELAKGMNSIDYDLTVDESARSKYHQQLKKDNKDFKWEEPDDGQAYLEVGIYDVKVMKGTASSSTKLTVRE